MKVDRITYQKIFPTGMAYLNHKIGVEIQVEENDDWEEAFKMAKNFVEQMNLDSNPGMAAAMEYAKFGNSTEPKPTKDSKESATDRMLTAINTCTDIKVLETFRLLVQNNQVFQEAYDNKLKQLQ